MNRQIINIYHRLLGSVPEKTYRFLFSKFNIDSRLTGLIGPRGTGKTTLLLQYINRNIQDKDECIYASLDHIYFSDILLFDFIEEAYEIDGIRYFFFDEVHKYDNWSQELKNAYDSFPDIKIVFSGSSAMDLIRGSYDLSRRGKLFRLPGLSFREYILFKEGVEFSSINFETILNIKNEDIENISNYKKLLGLFGEYLGFGYYPFVFEDRINYNEKVLGIIDKIIFEDIASFFKLKTENLHYFKRILSYISTIPPGSLNRNSISKNIGLDNKTVQNYLEILQKTGLILLIAEKKSGSGLLKQKEKIYLNNPNIYSAITKDIGLEFSLGTFREVFFVNMIRNLEYPIYYSRAGDFLVKDSIFEVGCKNKTKRQILKTPEKSFLVKDNILHKTKDEIPLFLFGFLY